MWAGDDWSAMMNACGASPLDTECVSEPTPGAPQGNCGSRYAAIPFFVSFQFLGSFVFLNLIVAVSTEGLQPPAQGIAAALCITSTSACIAPILHLRCIYFAPTLHLRCIYSAPTLHLLCTQVIIDNFTSLGKVDPNLVSAEDIANFKEARALHTSTCYLPPLPSTPSPLHPSTSPPGVGPVRPGRQQLDPRGAAPCAAAEHPTTNGPRHCGHACGLERQVVVRGQGARGEPLRHAQPARARGRGQVRRGASQ